MALLNENIQKQISELLAPMKEKVVINLFTTNDENCETCKDTLDYMNELTSLSQNLELKTYTSDEINEINKYSIEMYPAISLTNENMEDKGVKFYGMPAGHEINSLLTSIMELSGAGEELSEDIMSFLNTVDKPIDIKVFVTLGCPHCPGAVIKAHKLAMSNKNITAQMIEANTFDELSDKYNVSSVPRIIINETGDLLGNVPLEEFITIIKKFN
jgi:glutaredoxin-like protein